MALSAVIIPKNPTVKNAHLKPMAWDKNPMMGGPIKKPKNPTEETEANAILTWLGSVVLPMVP